MLNIPRFRPTASIREMAAFVRGLFPGSGNPVGQFESGLSRSSLGGRRVVVTPSARIAFYWLLEALDIGAGDEVVVQAFNFPAVPAAVRATGATVRFIDVAPGTFEADWSQLERRVGDRTKAVIATHLYGNPVDLQTVRAWCEARGLILIEDCAQAIGATSSAHQVGTFGAGAFFSLGPTKNLTLLGGGAVSVRDAARFERIVDRASHHRPLGPGPSVKLAAKAAVMGVATHPLVFSTVVLPILKAFERRGTDLVHQVMQEPPGPLTNIDQALLPSRAMGAVGVSQLRRLERNNRARIRNGWYLRSRLEGVDGLALCPMRVGSIFMSFPVLHPDRRALAAELRRRGVDTDFGFMADCSGIDPADSAGGSCPNAERVAREILHLPVHPFLKKRHLDRIAEVVRRAIEGSRGR